MKLDYQRGMPIFYTTKDRDEWQSLMRKLYEQTNNFEPTDLEVGGKIYPKVFITHMKSEFSNGEYTIGIVVESADE